jgi:16S rRNA U1498 N3-methylase RsmE
VRGNRSDWFSFFSLGAISGFKYCLWRKEYAHLGREKTWENHKKSPEETKTLQRFEKILIEATEQSHGAKIPEIHLHDTIPNIEGICFFAHTSLETPGIISLWELSKKSEYFVWDVSFLIWPEGW